VGSIMAEPQYWATVQFLGQLKGKEVHNYTAVYLGRVTVKSRSATELCQTKMGPEYKDDGQ
jgi:hypothetical protein